MRGWEGIVRARVQGRRGGDVPSRVSYIERIGKRWAVDTDGLGARSLSKVRESGSEILQQLFIRLLRIGPAEWSAHVPELCWACALSARQAHNTVGALSGE